MARNRIICPNCSNSVVSSLRFCPKCGFALGINESFDEDPYEVLQVSRSATREVIDASYRALAKQYHPDSGSTNSDRMKDLNQAYAILTNKAKKAKWEAEHKSEQETRQQEKTPQQNKGSNFESSENAEASPNTKPPLLTPIAWGLVIILGAVWVMGGFQASPLASPTATPRLIRQPTSTSRISNLLNSIATQNASYIQGCLPFDKVTSDYIGQRICIYGIVYEAWREGLYYEGDSIWYLTFNREKTYSSYYFRVLSRSGYYSVTAGECIRVDGVVRKFSDANYPYIDPFRDSGQMYSLPLSSCQ